MNDLDLFQYTVLENANKQTIFLFHGTGGTQHDLLPLVEPFQKMYTIVGLLGNVREYGMPRFFERTGEGIFNQESIKTESSKLAEFIKAWNKKHQLSSADNIFIGYSNGANFILAMMFYFPDLIQKAVLLHPMLPFTPEENLDLSNHQLLLSWSKIDPIISFIESQKVISTLQTHLANVQVIETQAGHSITQEEVNILHTFVRKQV